MIPKDMPPTTYFSDPDAIWVVKYFCPYLNETANRYYKDEFTARRAMKLLSQCGNTCITLTPHDSSEKLVYDNGSLSYMDGLFD
jgi:hypothetical protein